MAQDTGNMSAMSAVIVGAGGFGREVLEIFKAQNAIAHRWNILGFLDDDERLRGAVVNGYPVLGGIDWLGRNNREDLYCVCAVGDCEIRKRLVERLTALGARFCNVIHPSVIMSEFVELGQGNIICAGAILTVNISIGNHVHINLNSYIGHDAVIGSYCTISPMVSLGGETRFGEGVFVGIGAKFVQRTTVGDWATIGAGAVVISDVPARVVAVGTPARPIRQE